MQNLKFKFTISIVLIFGTFSVILAREGSVISILRPDGTAVTEKEQILEGKVEESFIRSLQLTVEPFLIRENEKKYSRRIEVKGGLFLEKITLFPGLNLISLSSVGGKEFSVKPIFLVSPDKKPFEETENFGIESQIVFLAPSETKVNSQLVTIKGMVTGSAIKALDIVIIGTLDFSTKPTIETEKKQQIDFYRVQVKNQQFGFLGGLKEGLNIILAKVSGQPTTVSLLQMKSLIYEKVSSELSLNEPELKKNKLYITGKVGNISLKKVRIKISALVEKDIRHNEIIPETILDRTVNIGRDGNFSLTVPWEEEKQNYTIKSSPTIYAYAGDEVATKTLIKWW